MTITATIRHPDEAAYNKRIASISFTIIKNYYGCWELRTYPIHLSQIYVSRSRTKIEAVREFLDGLPLIELDSFLRAKNAAYGKWLDKGETC